MTNPQENSGKPITVQPMTCMFGQCDLLRSFAYAQDELPIDARHARKASVRLENCYMGRSTLVPMNGEKKTEREGFEPSVRLPAHRISSAAPSATRTPLHMQVFLSENHCFSDYAAIVSESMVTQHSIAFLPTCNATRSDGVVNEHKGETIHGL